MILRRETVRMLKACLIYHACLKASLIYPRHACRAILEAEVVCLAARDHEQNKALISQLFELGVGA